MMWNVGVTSRAWWEPVRQHAIQWAVPLCLIGVIVSPVSLFFPATAHAAACEIPRERSPLQQAEDAKDGDDAAAGSSAIEIADAESVASPESSPGTPVAVVVDPAKMLADELTAAADALAACLSAGDVEMVVRLAGERYLGQLFGSSVPMPREEYIALAQALTPVPTRIVQLEAVTQIKRGHVTALVTHVVGNQLMQAEWEFEQAPRGERHADENEWRIVAERQQPASAPRGAETIDVDIADWSFALDRRSVSGPDVVLRGVNNAGEDHEMLVLRYAPGYTSADLLRATGPDLPAEVTFIGEVPVRAGSTRDLVLVDLEPGVYTLICLFPDADGIPHLARGMEATFTVE